jgi:hypothetical protein
MADLAVTNTFTSGTTIIASEVNANFSDVVNYINNRNSASASWTALAVSGNSTIGGTLIVSGATTLGSTLAVTGISSFANGAAATPSLTFASDTDTGMYRISANAIGFSSGGTLRWAITGSGDLGANANELLLVSPGTVSSPGVQFNSDSNTGVYLIAADNIGIAVGGVKFVDAKTTRGFGILGCDGTIDSLSGFVGEYISASDSTLGNIGLTTVWQDQVSISLTAGDWDITGSAFFIANGATLTDGYGVAVSINSGNTTTDHVFGNNVLYGAISTGTIVSSSSTVVYRLLLSAMTTVYLKTVATYTGGPPQALGTIKARRVR